MADPQDLLDEQETDDGHCDENTLHPEQAQEGKDVEDQLKNRRQLTESLREGCHGHKAEEEVVGLEEGAVEVGDDVDGEGGQAMQRKDTKFKRNEGYF